jgi:hypothetical protein
LNVALNAKEGRTDLTIGLEAKLLFVKEYFSSILDSNYDTPLHYQPCLQISD